LTFNTICIIADITIKEATGTRHEHLRKQVQLGFCLDLHRVYAHFLKVHLDKAVWIHHILGDVEFPLL
jgi:hypothetical protein